MSPLYRFLYPIAWFIFKIMFRFEIKGKENIPKDKNFIIFGNHIAFTDPVFLGLCVGHKRQVHFMAKEELFKNHKFVGGFLSKLGAFSINRDVGIEGINTAIDLVKDGKILGIFPEGTRSKTGKLGRAKSGISLIMCQTKSDALPCVIKCKDQKVKPFRKITVEIFKVISADELSIEDISNHRELKKITTKIMTPIQEALEPAKTEE
ncbi:MAG: 1-acyl-sn-glycerol-3-phosphate acyltransferase [Clostridia bacterium]|nr:1-acyl-sn-glycerol-3-phosphate acyltransferase [Clostridia bacterium]